MITVWLIVGIAALIGMVVCAKKKENPKAKPVAAIFLIIAIVCCGIHVRDTGVFGEDKATRDQRASYARYEESAAKALGEYLNSKFGSEKIIIVAPGGNDFQKNMENNKLPEKLKSYLPNAEIKGLDYSNNPDEGPMMGATAKHFNDFFKANADTKLFVLIENLPFEPSEAAKLTLWKNKGAQKIALANGDLSMLYPYFKQGIVAAGVCVKTGLTEADYDKLAPSDLKEAFAARYFLVTSENVDQFKDKNIFR